MKFYGGRRKPTHLQNDGRLTGKQRGVIGIAVSLLVLAGTLFAIYRAAVRPPERSVPAQTGLKEESSPAERVQASAPEAEEAAALPAQTPVSHRRGVYNILLCGTDGDGLRTDTIMLGHLDERSGAAALLSIPREMLRNSRTGVFPSRAAKQAMSWPLSPTRSSPARCSTSSTSR